MTGDFVNGLMEGESALESFKNFAKSMVSQIIATFINLMVVNKILNGIFNLGLPEMGFPSGGGVSGGVGDITRSAIPSPATSPPKFIQKAGGGSVNGGSPYLVGERGPEMFVPNSGGRIANGHNTKNMMGGGGGVVINQTINLSAGVVGTVRSEVQRMMPQIANVTKAGVLEATRRGGTYRRGLLGS
jgi:phage-related minor tail protein